VTSRPPIDDARPAGAGPRVVAVSTSGRHSFSKEQVGAIRLLEGLGVEGDAHSGATVQHLSRVRRDPTQPNLRQVHLIAAELFDEVLAAGYDVHAGSLGENVTTRDVDLLGLPAGTLLRLGPDAEVEVTGLRNPCRQIDGFASGLLKQVLGRDAAGETVRRAGVMGVVRRTGVVSPGDTVTVVLPAEPHAALAPV
jgi:MOSC domain-containing protein YiiM